MALRIQYCLLFADPNRVPQGGGSATISFDPLALAQAPRGVSLHKVREIGPPGPYLRKPIVMVTARQFQIGSAAPQTLGIDDAATRTEVTVSWRGGHVKTHEEMPVLVIGEVADPAPRAQGELITIRVPNDRVRVRVRDLLEGIDLRPEPSFEPGRKKQRASRHTKRRAPRRRA